MPFRCHVLPLTVAARIERNKRDLLNVGRTTITLSMVIVLHTVQPELSEGYSSLLI
jgi:hypothetical protein